MSEVPTNPQPTGPVTARLLDACERLLAEKGIRSTTMQEVAETAGVSRAWLYRHFPDKSTLIGAAIVRLNESFWVDAVGELEAIDGLDRQVSAGVRIGRGAYDDPGTLLMRLRTTEPDEFAACAGAGVAGLVPDLAAFWRPFIDAAAERGEIHPDHDFGEVSEWVARVLISLGTVPGDAVDPDDSDAVLRHVRRYLMPGLRTTPEE
ncbi:TetR/AcrR family transcriptional regulator [Gordonia hankookensis]|uniref:TetR/AcrR family transcriptional regulator n=1 Tax=Gordonia hankookensis TaxID=589403 RepID=A0ABR7W7V5_9ACTN|nr:TetR/AcrR family transcriptional regulator [Gordonia hankookensis]MBD1318908.1 TetR/AcrR family transcriptional regulator [Gordonia hankookensis]